MWPITEKRPAWRGGRCLDVTSARLRTGTLWWYQRRQASLILEEVHSLRMIVGASLRARHNSLIFLNISQQGPLAMRKEKNLHGVCMARKRTECSSAGAAFLTAFTAMLSRKQAPHWPNAES